MTLYNIINKIPMSKNSKIEEPFFNNLNKNTEYVNKCTYCISCDKWVSKHYMTSKRHTKTKLHKDNVMKYCTYLFDIETKSIETPKTFLSKQLLANEKYSASVSL
jgi:hypothetical protein